MEDDETLAALGRLGPGYFPSLIKIGIIAASLYVLLSFLGLWPF